MPPGGELPGEGDKLAGLTWVLVTGRVTGRGVIGKVTEGRGRDIFGKETFPLPPFQWPFKSNLIQLYSLLL